MSSLAEMSRPETDRHGARPRAVLRGETRPDLIRDEVLAEIFRETARARADHPALIDGATVAAGGLHPHLSYAQVLARAEAIAAGLAHRGIGPGDVVGLWMARGIDLLVAQIGITLSGAAWLPFDAEAPADRVGICLGDAAAKALLVSPALAAQAPDAAPALTPEALAAATPADATLPDPRAAGLTPEHPAYLIYTSGSTGVPKGIVISHANICHFLRSANALYGMRADDVVFQGASVAFDLSMEEIWVPYLVGATLFVASPAMMGDLESLPGILEAQRITVLDTVPTLLAMISGDLPHLRLVLLGGEALPEPLVARWATGRRQLFNTYGPTEATVVATAAEMRRGEPVTIGGPIANYTAYVADEALNLLGTAEQGELLIGGPGIAKGYLKRPELTAEKFIANPFAEGGIDPVLYRSGDAVSLDEAGNILFHGRIDDQVKIRGFRVELGEIESRIRAQDGINQAAVVLRADDGVDRLVAFLVPERGHTVDRAALRRSLSEQMPPYMVPGHYELTETLSRLTSGKVDRKALKIAPLTIVAADGEQEPPANETEAVLLAAAKQVFGNQPIDLSGDFFADLGGHSLIAARFVSAVREAPALAGITLQDVYAERTLRAMSDALIARTGGVGAETAIRDLSFEPPPLLRRALCGLAQAVALPFVIALATSQWLGIFVTYLLLTGGGLGFFGEMAVLLAVYVGINATTACIAVGAKWLILGRTKPGRYPLWGAYYYRWWLAQRLAPLVHVKWLQGSPAIAIYLRLMGAKVGRDALISDIEVGAPDLLSIGEGASLGGRLVIANAEIVGNELVIGSVRIGADAAIGTSCVVSHDTVIGDHAEIADLTTIPAGTRVGPCERWDGSPGRKVGTADPAALPPPAEAPAGRRALFLALYVALLAAIPAIGLLPIFPAFFIFDQISDQLGFITDIDYHWYLPLLTWPTAMLMTAGTVLLIAGIRWLVLPRRRSGAYSVHSWFYLRKWSLALAVEVTLETLSSLFATVYMRAWYRLMGARMGQGAEISTNLSGRYDLAEIGAKNFIADEVVYGEEEIRRGTMHLAEARTGARVFVGNDAVIPPGAVIPDDVLIGIKSKPPANEQMAPGETWFGSPPIRLPVRQKVDLGSLSQTFEPGLWPKLRRGIFEAFATSFSPMLYITLAITAIDWYFYPEILEGDWWGLAGTFVAASVVIALIQCSAVIAMKWLLMGVYQPGMRPMWSWWAMRTEAIAVAYWGLAGKVLLEHLQGTPFLPWVLRLFGVSVGQGVCMLTTDITEFDCVEIGDFSVINRTSALQTHLYEDRIMKIGRVKLGRGVSVGAFATVLYDTKVGDYARLRPLTIVMKGESIPANSEWEGAPAVPVVHAPEAAKAAA
ncbi:Pls/PosA family non-ribosomal peptide synthetase [Methylobacterium dankookense]|uniref:D-alanine--D-alanyl carrier protein ligase n=1 Tax=Methylobacterium dankookense TaxID=560405 RepID=A0A564FZ74_9HYPH|nr:Pls/PosA family non-ribosomal peptide synthetase [Methylobacterium dankookense]GJD54527.1 D-alanine--D-alanyl carrier protein ligase [Methylobacterium dankookense]VUF13277.1 Linear gramicidin synthase subunit D [Methylobacterium dankookense]